jgi:preprotein translocase subunit SecF
MKLPLPKNIPFVQYRYYFLALSIIAVIASIVIIAVRGLNYGIDFEGGVKLTVSFNSAVSDGEVQDVLDGKNVISVVQRMDDPSKNRFTIKTKQFEETIEGTVSSVKSIIVDQYGAGGFVVEQEETVGPKVGEELRRDGLLAIIITLAAMLVYIWFRFELFFAPGAILALLHDVIIVIGFLSLFGKEYNLSILAALLTIVGYSVNDTIVVFDRIREHGSQISKMTIDSVVNQSLNESLSRTIITSLTALIAVVILYLFGGGVIHDFAFCFIIGIVAGTYSSIFVASPVYIFLYKKFHKVTT